MGLTIEPWYDIINLSNERNKRKMNEKMKENVSKVSKSVVVLFLTPLIIKAGWNVLVYHFNLPVLTYWEIFWIRWGLSAFIRTITNFNKKEKVINIDIDNTKK